MRKEMVIAAVVGMLMLVISFNLYVPLNNATDNLFRFFTVSCQDGNTRFAKAYIGVTSLSADPGTAVLQYNTTTETFGGPGTRINRLAGSTTCQIPAITYTIAANDTLALYSERGDQIASKTYTEAATSTGAIDLSTSIYSWYVPDDSLGDFIGIIKTLISLSPVIVTAGFLALAGKGLVQYGMGVGTGGLADAIGASVMTLVVNIVVMYLAPIGMDAVVNAAAVTQSGAQGVNQEFKGVQGLLFAVIPLIMVAVIIGSNLIAGGAGNFVMKRMGGKESGGRRGGRGGRGAVGEMMGV